MQKDDELDALHKKRGIFFCVNYFYTGIVEDWNATVIKLSKPAKVYETGPWDKEKFQDEQVLNMEYIYIHRQSIESSGLAK